MPRFVAVHPVAFKDEELTAFLARREQLPSSVVWRSCLVAADEHVSYCEWDAPEARLLREVFEAFGVPCSAVQEVRVFDPAARLSQAA